MVALECFPCVRIFPGMKHCKAWVHLLHLPSRVKSRTAGRGRRPMVPTRNMNMNMPTAGCPLYFLWWSVQHTQYSIASCVVKRNRSFSSRTFYFEFSPRVGAALLTARAASSLIIPRRWRGHEGCCCPYQDKYLQPFILAVNPKYPPPPTSSSWPSSLGNTVYIDMDGVSTLRNRLFTWSLSDCIHSMYANNIYAYPIQCRAWTK